MNGANLPAADRKELVWLNERLDQLEVELKDTERRHNNSHGSESHAIWQHLMTLDRELHSIHDRIWTLFSMERAILQEQAEEQRYELMSEYGWQNR